MDDLKAFANDLDQVYARLRKGVQTNPRGYEWRISQLQALKRLVDENDEALSAAMWKDLRKSTFECEVSEQGVVLGEINYTTKHLKKWMKPKSVSTPLFSQVGRSQIVREPYGLALIVGAWNYPVNLTLAPLVAAIAGGNGAIIKPSEISANTSAILAKLVPKYMDPDLFAVIEGGVGQTDLLLNKVFDTIFFTGSGPVGKIILAKAAPHLTPATLELGGKSPGIILKDADLAVTARRIAWGKFMNAGQTCVAPDYILIQPEIREAFITELKKVLLEFYGTDMKGNQDYCRIINTKNFDRLTKLMQGLPVLHGGESDREQLYIAPTVVSATASAPIMQDEIFGPILPILEINDVGEMLEFVQARPKPLALYVFTKDETIVERFVNETSAGSMTVNDVVIHMPIATLPFGGIGSSGMGNYHGEFGFNTFTHAKGILRKSFLMDIPVRYPPYTERKARILRWLLS